jgi:hypothetical protein
MILQLIRPHYKFFNFFAIHFESLNNLVIQGHHHLVLKEIKAKKNLLHQMYFFV